MNDFIGLVLGEVYNRDHMKNHEEFKEIVYSAMYKLSLDYIDRVDDVATRKMSLEIDSLNQTVDGLRDENRRLRDKEPV